MAIHCQVITSQVSGVAGSRLPRDRTSPRRLGAGGLPGVRRKVIITSLSVNGRYFGRVTVRSAGSLAGQVTSLCGGEQRPGTGGNGPGPSDDWCSAPEALPSSRGDDLVAGGRSRGAAIAGKRSSAGHLIGCGRVFYDAAGKAGAAVNSGLLHPAGIRRRMHLCARFAGLPPGDDRPCRAGAARGGLGRVARSGRAGDRDGPGGREAAVAAILVISPASCRGRHHTRASALARAVLGTYSLDHA